MTQSISCANFAQASHKAVRIRVALRLEGSRFIVWDGLSAASDFLLPAWYKQCVLQTCPFGDTVIHH